MSVSLRPIDANDIDECGRICFEAFAAIARRHGFPLDFPSAEVGAAMIGANVSNPGFYGVVAESQSGRILGSNFMDERGRMFGLGPITVDPESQDGSVGRELMEHMIHRTRELGALGVRLLQAAYHNRSLCLYEKLGFDTIGPISNLSGGPINVEVPGHVVREAKAGDVEACASICEQVHGFDRSGQLKDAIEQDSGLVVECGSEIVGYSSGVNFVGHSVALTNDALKALIAAAGEIPHPGLLLPARNSEVFRWCLENGLRQNQLMTLMALDDYQEPQGAYLCSILY